MTKEDFEKLSNSMQEKLGKENASLIADDLGTLLADNVSVNTQINNLEKEKTKLKEEKERLIETNGNLLKQVSMGFSEEEKEKGLEKETEKNKITYDDMYDDKGNFIE